MLYYIVRNTIAFVTKSIVFVLFFFRLATSFYFLPTHMNSSQILSQLNRRYATKHFDTMKKLSPEQLHTLEEVLRLSPSSFGLQGRGFVVVENAELRQQLLPYAWNQAQVTEASHLIVLCRRTDVNTDFVQHYFDTMATARNQDISQLDGYKNMILGFLEAKDDTTLAQWLTKQVYIAQ